MLTLPNGKLTEEYLEHLNTAVNAPENPVTFLSVDPGKSNGVCGYDEKFYIQFMFVVKADDMVMFLHQFHKIQKCVVEGYRVFPGKQDQHIYDSLETPRVIGRIESWSQTRKIDLIIQPSSIKPTAYKWIGKKPLPKSNPQNHPLDAHVHFIYWAITSGKMSPDVLLR